MDGIMLESLLEWTLNGVPQRPVLCSGQDGEALLAGRLITSGAAEGVPKVRQTADGFSVTADLTGAEGDSLRRLETMWPNPSIRTATWEELRRLCGQVMGLDHSAGLHAILLSDGEKTVIGRDVGRHNALDKAVGFALREGLRLEQAVLCSSGRLSLEMFAKAAFARIPILATRKQVGSLCVQYAEKLDTAVCRLGGETVCFSAAWRITE